MLHRTTALPALIVSLALPLLAAAPSVAAGSDAGSAAAVHGWGTPTEQDDFSGTALDTSAWQPYDGAGNAGQGVRDPSQVSVSDGVLTLDGTADGTTGGLNARAEHKYGRWETRMRVPAGDEHYHPVLLLWPTQVAWPTGGEVDYAETDAGEGDIWFFLHFGADNQQTYSRTPVDLTQWHDYAVEWTPSGIVGYVDGVETFRDTTASHQPPGPVHASIQLDWLPEGASSTPPGQMQVDWTRYYAV